MEKILINISNHPSAKWSEEQKKGWDRILDIPFPQISPEWGEETVHQMSYDIREQVEGIKIEQGTRPFIMLQGEFSLCYLLYEKLRNGGYKIAIPTTSREVIEETTSTGEVVKKSIFRFVRWRII
jgi:hypothetical protein